MPINKTDLSLYVKNKLYKISIQSLIYYGIACPVGLAAGTAGNRHSESSEESQLLTSIFLACPESISWDSIFDIPPSSSSFFF